MPSLLERLLADALSLADSGIAWQLPRQLPEAAAVRAEIARLTVPPVDTNHAMQCLAKLTVAFEGSGRLTNDEARLRAATWMEANGDLGRELWSEATTWCLRNHRYGMPTTAAFRRAVIDQLTLRQRRLDACRRLLAALEARQRSRRGGDDSRSEAEKERARIARETWLLCNGPPAERRAIRARRLGDLVASNLKYGNTDRAAAHQAALDALERQRRAEGEIE